MLVVESLDYAEVREVIDKSSCGWATSPRTKRVPLGQAGWLAVDKLIEDKRHLEGDVY